MIDNDRTLLFEDSDPGVPGTSWWSTPGGGIDEGESEIHAAIREVAEETGYELGAAELLGPIAKRHVVHGYSDLVIEQDESFFLAMVSPFEVDISAHTPDERLTLLGHRWWTHDDLRHTDEWIWPHELVELWSLAGQPDIWPIDLGTQEESTVLDVSPRPTRRPSRGIATSAAGDPAPVLRPASMDTKGFAHRPLTGSGREPDARDACTRDVVPHEAHELAV